MLIFVLVKIVRYQELIPLNCSITIKLKAAAFFLLDQVLASSERFINRKLVFCTYFKIRISYDDRRSVSLKCEEEEGTSRQVI